MTAEVLAQDSKDYGGAMDSRASVRCSEDSCARFRFVVALLDRAETIPVTPRLRYAGPASISLVPRFTDRNIDH